MSAEIRVTLDVIVERSDKTEDAARITRRFYPGVDRVVRDEEAATLQAITRTVREFAQRFDGAEEYEEVDE